MRRHENNKLLNFFFCKKEQNMKVFKKFCANAVTRLQPPYQALPNFWTIKRLPRHLFGKQPCEKMWKMWIMHPHMVQTLVELDDNVLLEDILMRMSMHDQQFYYPHKFLSALRALEPTFVYKFLRQYNPHMTIATIQFFIELRTSLGYVLPHVERNMKSTKKALKMAQIEIETFCDVIKLRSDFVHDFIASLEILNTGWLHVAKLEHEFQQNILPQLAKQSKETLNQLIVKISELKNVDAQTEAFQILSKSTHEWKHLVSLGRHNLDIYKANLTHLQAIQMPAVVDEMTKNKARRWKVPVDQFSEKVTDILRATQLQIQHIQNQTLSLQEKQQNIVEAIAKLYKDKLEALFDASYPHTLPIYFAVHILDTSWPQVRNFLVAEKTRLGISQEALAAATKKFI